MIAALVRTIFVQPDLADAKRQLGRAVEALRRRYPKVAALWALAEEDILAHLSFPEARKRLHFTNPLERLHKETKRRSNVVGDLPQPGGGPTPHRGAPDGAERRVGRRPAVLWAESMAAATAPGGSCQLVLAEADIAAS